MAAGSSSSSERSTTSIIFFGGPPDAVCGEEATVEAGVDTVGIEVAGEAAVL